MATIRKATKVQTRCINIDGETVGVRTLDEARAAWLSYRDESGKGSSELAPGTGDYYENGVKVAHVSYNGRMWTPEQWPACTEIK